MIKFTPAIVDDIAEIAEWINLDGDHQNKGIPANWWLTGNDCITAGCIEDQSGPVMYLRIDAEGDFVRGHIQFGPESRVSKKRTALVLLEGLPAVALEMKKKGFKGILFESTCPSLIAFMNKLKFNRVTDTNDYLLLFEEN
jgi:hypothetical protein